MNTKIAIMAVLFWVASASPSLAITYTTLDDPMAGPGGTVPHGISGGNIVGLFFDSSNVNHGFLYNGSTYTTLDDPLAMTGTIAFGVSGGNIVGAYGDSSAIRHGFLYNGTTYTTLDATVGKRMEPRPLAIPAATLSATMTTLQTYGTVFSIMVRPGRRWTIH